MDFRVTRIRKREMDKKKKLVIFHGLIHGFPVLCDTESVLETKKSSHQSLLPKADNAKLAHGDLTYQVPLSNLNFYVPAAYSDKPLQTELLHKRVGMIEPPTVVDPLIQIPPVQRFFDPVPVSDVEQPQVESLKQEDLIDELIHIDTMLYMQSSIASMNYTNDPAHLLEMIASQHLGLDNILKRLGVEIHHSQVGDEFNSELMQAESDFISTDDEHLHGCIAKSVTPLFLRIGNESKEKRVLQYERVMLYAKND